MVVLDGTTVLNQRADLLVQVVQHQVVLVVADVVKANLFVVLLEDV